MFCRKGVLRNVPKFTGKHRCNFIKKEILAQVFSREFCEISKNTFFHITPPVAASIFISMLQNFSEKLFSSIPLACSFWRLLDIQGFLFLHFKIMIRTLEVCQFLLCLKAEIRHHFKMIISKWSYWNDRVFYKKWHLFHFNMRKLNMFNFLHIKIIEDFFWNYQTQCVYGHFQAEILRLDFHFSLLKWH